VKTTLTHRILIIDGHPDLRSERFVHALCEAYALGAKQAGHDVRVLKLAELKFPLLKTNEDFISGTPPESIQDVQADIVWCNHLVILYPLWLGSMPALLKAFFEQTLRPGFAFKTEPGAKMPKKLLKEKSCRLVVTMGMPSLFYKWYFRAHSLKSLERNILTFVGISPVRASVVGSVESMSAAKRAGWLERMRAYATLAK
jgi:putative NADPH-quinone reductase